MPGTIGMQVAESESEASVVSHFNLQSGLTLAGPTSLLGSVRVAALIACRWQALTTIGEVALPGNRRYWTYSKSRFQRWSRCAHYFQHSFPSTPSAQTVRWAQVQSFYHEVFSTEILTRMWAACAVAMDRANGVRKLDSYANSVLLDHLDIRVRCLRMLEQQSGFTPDQILQLESVRRRSERWTDLLLSSMAGSIDVEQWAFEPNRVLDFSMSTTGSHTPEILGSLIDASLRGTVLDNCRIRALHPALNKRIVDSILAMCDGHIVDATGGFSDLWVARLSHRAADLQWWIRDVVEGIESA